jgi:hypothetical protein
MESLVRIKKEIIKSCTDKEWITNRTLQALSCQEGYQSLLITVGEPKEVWDTMKGDILP